METLSPEDLLSCSPTTPKRKQEGPEDMLGPTLWRCAMGGGLSGHDNDAGSFNELKDNVVQS